MPSIFNQPGSAPTIDYNNSVVEIAQDWGNWQFVPYLFCKTHKQGLPPDTGRAAFHYRTGEEQLEGEDVPDIIGPLDLVDLYVRVSIQQPFSDPVPVWWGIFADQTTVSERTDLQSGDQEFQAQGIEYLLDRCRINGAKAIKTNPKGSNPATVTVSLNSALSFNRKPTKGKALVGNRSHNLGPQGVYMFGAYGEKWSNLQIAQHLLQFYGPDNVTFQIVGQTDPLDQMIAYHDFKEGTSLWKALTQLIDHRKGLIMVPYVGDDGTVYLYVDTVQNNAIQVAGMTIPPNSNPVQFTMPGPPYDQLVDDVPITKTDKTNYGQILVYGARVKMMFPASFANSKAWGQLLYPPNNGNLLHTGDILVDPNTGQKVIDQYRTGVPGGAGNADQNDKERARDYYKDIFQRFYVDRKWDGTVVDNASDKTQNVIAIPFPDGTIDINPPDGQQKQLKTDLDGAQFVLFDKVYYKNLPTKKGVDYTKNPPVDNNPNPHRAEYVPLLVLYYDSDNGSLHNADQQWHKIEKFTSDNKSVKNLTAHKADIELGIHIEATPNHYLALNHWQGANPTNKNPELDYTNLVVVGCIDLDVRPCVQWQSPFGGNRTKIEVLPSCRFMYAVPGCPFDVGNNGQLLYLDFDNLILDDDHEVLQQITAEMAAWYGLPRQTISITVKQPGIYVGLGSFLEQMNTAYSTEPIGTLINSIEVDYDRQTTTIRTGFEELDYVHLLGRPEDLGEEEVAE
jgi:hypothetical protein